MLLSQSTRQVARQPRQSTSAPFAFGSYARFMPARYREYLQARYARNLIRRAPGATTGLPGAQDQVYRYDAIAAAPAPIVPLVSAGAESGRTIPAP